MLGMLLADAVEAPQDHQGKVPARLPTLPPSREDLSVPSPSQADHSPSSQAWLSCMRSLSACL